ncbi:CGNR zinc finger domain-containing protein [Georgenia sp. SUBG003]|uniref:CGNR zinc finger domain-containing protein n=1 Tax=Georgenia sp. SUBG003 TaxID=1497974 RepID=UPI003AB5DD83
MSRPPGLPCEAWSSCPGSRSPTSWISSTTTPSARVLPRATRRRGTGRSTRCSGRSRSRWASGRRTSCTDSPTRPTRSSWRPRRAATSHRCSTPSWPRRGRRRCWRGTATSPGRWPRGAAGLRGALGVVLLDWLHTNGPERLGVCGGHRCADAFVDASPAGRKKFCSAGCLNRHKVAEHRRRAAARAAR